MNHKDPRSEPHPLISGSSAQHRHRANSVPEVVFLNQLRPLGEEDHHRHFNHHHDNHHRDNYSHDHHRHDQHRHDYSASATSTVEYLHGQGIRRKGKSSWKDILKLKRKKAKLRSPPHLVDKVATETDVYHPRIGGYCIRVVVTEINPQAYYKTLEVTDHTTAFEVIVRLIQKYAVKEEDRDPNEFYLMEVKEGTQGSYSRVLANTDQLYELQCKWSEDEDCYFALYRAQLPPMQEPEVEDKFEQPDINNFKAMIISPSQDSFFDSFPDPRDNSFFPSFSPLPLPTSTHSMTTPTTQTLPSYRDLSSRVQVSKLILSPPENNYEQEAENVSENHQTNQTFSFSPAKSTGSKSTAAKSTAAKYSSFSDPRIDTIAEIEAEDDTVVKSEPRISSDSSHLRYTQRKVMQKSLSMGMQGIMAKVVSETKQNSPLRVKAHERSQSSPSQFLSARVSQLPLSSASPQQDLTIRNLVCSPLAPTQVNRSKNIPDFVFTPGPDDAVTSDSSEADFPGSESSEPIKSGGSLEKSFNFVGVLDFDSCTDESKSEDDEQGHWGELATRDREKRSLTDEQRSDVAGGLLDIAEEEDENGDDEGERQWYDEIEEEQPEVVEVCTHAEATIEFQEEVGKDLKEYSENEEPFTEADDVNSENEDKCLGGGKKENTRDDGEYSGNTGSVTDEDRDNTEDIHEVSSEASKDGDSEEVEVADHDSGENETSDKDSEKDAVENDRDISEEDVMSNDKSSEDNFVEASWENIVSIKEGTKEPIESNIYRDIEKCDNLITNFPNKALSLQSKSPPHFRDVATLPNRIDCPSPSNHSPSVMAKGNLEAKMVIQVKNFSTEQLNQPEQLQTAQSEPNFETVDMEEDNDKTNNVLSELKSTENIARVRPTAPVNIPLRRSHTSQGLFSSVTRVNRPHSVHFSSTPSNVTVDFTKDEIFRKAALKGMFKKPPKPSESPSDLATPNRVERKDKTFSFPVKDIVTDLDSVATGSIATGDKRHHKPFRRNSLFDIKSSSSTDQQYVRIKDKMAMLDGSPPRPVRQRPNERPKSIHFGDNDQGSSRPYSAPAKFKKF